MISVVRIFESFCQFDKSYISGNDPLPEFCDKLNDSQTEIMELVAPQYDRNERVKILMRPLIRPFITTSDSAGLITDVPEDVNRIIKATVVNGNDEFLLHYTHENSLSLTTRIPQRKPNIASRSAYYHWIDGNIQVYPKVALNVEFAYLKQPAKANLRYITTELTTGESALRVDNDSLTDLDLDETAFNLILYKVLEKYGIVTREVLLQQYGKLGIDTDLINA